MTETVLLAKRLSKISAYAKRIEPLLPAVPALMENNHQLHPLWKIWRQQQSANIPPERVFNKEQTKVLKDFFEYLYFASDSFIQSTRKLP